MRVVRGEVKDTYRRFALCGVHRYLGYANEVGEVSGAERCWLVQSGARTVVHFLGLARAPRHQRTRCVCCLIPPFPLYLAYAALENGLFSFCIRGYGNDA